MGFRKKRTEWDELLSKHSDLFHASGVPSYVYKDKNRFLVFLDHGYDEVGFLKEPHGAFCSSLLTDQQIETLARLVGDFIDSNYRIVVASRWSRR